MNIIWSIFHKLFVGVIQAAKIIHRLSERLAFLGLMGAHCGALEPLNTIVLWCSEAVQWGPQCVPMMPWDSCLSDRCRSGRCSFTSLDFFSVICIDLFWDFFRQTKLFQELKMILKKCNFQITVSIWKFYFLKKWNFKIIVTMWKFYFLNEC